jgi:hypothetical protein
MFETGWVRCMATIALVVFCSGCSGTVSNAGNEDSGSPADGATLDGQQPEDGAPPDAHDPEPDAATDPCLDSCSNGVQDCEETDVDCGGPCDACAEEEVWLEAGAEGEFPTVAATADKVVVAWNWVGEWGVHYRCKDASGWTDVANLNVGNAGTRFPRAQADSQGRIHLVVTRGAGGAIMYSVMGNEPTCEGSSWSAPLALVELAQGGGRYAHVAVDENDAPHVCFHDRLYADTWYTENTTGAWSTPVNVTDTPVDADSRYPDISVSGTTPHLVWEEDDTSYANTRPRYTYWTGSDFAPWHHLSEEQHSWPQIVSEANGNQHVLFTTRSGAEVRYWFKNGGNWEPHVALNSAPTDWSWTGLDLDLTGTLHGVWHELVSTYMQIHYATGEAATGTWVVPRQVSTNLTVHNSVPSVAADPAGHAHVVWLYDDGTGIGVHYRKVAYDDLPQ